MSRQWSDGIIIPSSGPPHTNIAANRQINGEGERARASGEVRAHVTLNIDQHVANVAVYVCVFGCLCACVLGYLGDYVFGCL